MFHSAAKVCGAVRRALDGGFGVKVDAVALVEPLRAVGTELIERATANQAEGSVEVCETFGAGRVGPLEEPVEE